MGKESVIVEQMYKLHPVLGFLVNVMLDGRLRRETEIKPFFLQVAIPDALRSIYCDVEFTAVKAHLSEVQYSNITIDTASSLITHAGDLLRIAQGIVDTFISSKGFYIFVPFRSSYNEREGKEAGSEEFLKPFISKATQKERKKISEVLYSPDTQGIDSIILVYQIRTLRGDYLVSEEFRRDVENFEGIVVSRIANFVVQKHFRATPEIQVRVI